MNKPKIIATLVFCLLLTACGSDTAPDPGEVVSFDIWLSTDNMAETETPSEPDVTPDSPFPEDFIVSFIYKGMVPNENTDKSDLYIVDSQGENPMAPGVKAPLALTTFAIDPEACQLVLAKKADGTPLTTAPCSCNLGCTIDDTLTWIAVTTEKPSANGFAFQIGKFNADLQVQMVKGTLFQNIVDLAFTGGYLYFSQVKYCHETGCQYLVYRYDLENIPEPQSQFLMPPDGDPDLVDGQATTDGHFIAAADGQTIAFISPTIRSARVYVWRKGEMKELDYVCPGGMQGDHCTGSGSNFSDLDPMALSHDGKKLSWFTQGPDGLELRFYDTDVGTLRKLTLMDTTGKDYATESCSQILGNDWKFNTVTEPRFTDADDGLVFLASSHCDKQKRPYTDVVKLPVSTIETGYLQQHTIKNLTNNPRVDGLENTIILTWDLSPDGGNIAYAASPIYDGSGNELSESSANANKSRELWVADLEGKQKKQITYNAKYTATWVKTLTTSAVKH